MDFKMASAYFSKVEAHNAHNWWSMYISPKLENETGIPLLPQVLNLSVQGLVGHRLKIQWMQLFEYTLFIEIYDIKTGRT
jgi:hypothetical protein